MTAKNDYSCHVPSPTTWAYQISFDLCVMSSNFSFLLSKEALARQSFLSFWFPGPSAYISAWGGRYSSHRLFSRTVVTSPLLRGPAHCREINQLQVVRDGLKKFVRGGILIGTLLGVVLDHQYSSTQQTRCLLAEAEDHVPGESCSSSSISSSEETLGFYSTVSRVHGMLVGCTCLGLSVETKMNSEMNSNSKSLSPVSSYYSYW